MAYVGVSELLTEAVFMLPLEARREFKNCSLFSIDAGLSWRGGDAVVMRVAGEERSMLIRLSNEEEVPPRLAFFGSSILSLNPVSLIELEGEEREPSCCV